MFFSCPGFRQVQCDVRVTEQRHGLVLTGAPRDGCPCSCGSDIRTKVSDRDAGCFLPDLRRRADTPTAEPARTVHRSVQQASTLTLLDSSSGVNT